MYLTDVAPLIKIPRPLPQILSYFTSQKLESGSLVLIPLRKKDVLAIVLSQRKAGLQKMEIKKAEFKLKPILKIIEPRPILSPHQIELSKWISKYYWASLGKTLSLFLPDFLLKKITKRKLSDNFFASQKLDLRQAPILPKLILSPLGFLPEEEIKEAIKKNQQVLFLIPEKSKSELWAKRLKKISHETSLFSINLSSKKYLETFCKIKQGKVKIIIGTRSALFAPFSNLKLTIITEEENKNYKSEKEPRYDTRKVANRLVASWGGKLIFLSSSPSVENYHLAHKPAQTSYFVQIDQEFNQIEKSIIDMKRLEKWSPISPQLFEEIKKNIFKKRKVILFLNRRGEATMLLCQDCGWICKCKNCDVPLVYHTQKQAIGTGERAMVCHHCGFKTVVPKYCENCKSWKLITLGVGGEKIENKLKKELKGARVLRIDSEVAPRESGQVKILKDFFEGNSNILITTSVLFKYLPLKKVDLVGIISLDSLLSLPDFRAEEEAARIIQKLLFYAKEKLIVQTFLPQSKAISWINENYSLFLRKTLKEREEFFYPPFSQLIKLSFFHKERKEAENEAKKLKQKLENQIQIIAKTHKLKLGTFEILGPAPAFIPKIKRKYVWKILIKIRNSKFEIRNSLLGVVPPNWKIDVDPIRIL